MMQYESRIIIRLINFPFSFLLSSVSGALREFYFLSCFGGVTGLSPLLGKKNSPILRQVELVNYVQIRTKGKNRRPEMDNDHVHPHCAHIQPPPHTYTPTLHLPHKHTPVQFLPSPNQVVAQNQFQGSYHLLANF